MTCANCGTEIQASANFCAQCGSAVKETVASADDTLTAPALTEPAESEVRHFGTLPPTFTLVACVAALLLGLVLLAGGFELAGALLLCLSAVFGLAIWTARKGSVTAAGPAWEPLEEAVGKGRAWLGYAGRSSSALVSAQAERLRLQQEERRLRQERDQVVRELGEAAYRDDGVVVADVRVRLATIDDAIADSRRRAEEAMRVARRQVEDERLALQGTAVIKPGETERDQ